MLAAMLVAPARLFAQPPGAPVWRISPVPLVTVGEAGDVEFLRIGTIQLRGDGSFLVGNGDPPELRFFNAQGALQRTLGRTGDGPGEFRGLGWAGILGDSTVAYDYNHRRLTIFSPDGTVLPTPPLPPSGRIGLAVSGRLRCGSWFASQIEALGRPGQSGLTRDSIHVAILSSGLERITHELGPFPAVTSVVISSGQGQAARMAVGIALFGASTLWGIADSLIYTMDTATPELVFWGCDGRRRHSITVPLPERPVPADVVQRLKERAASLARSEVSRSLAEARFASINLPKRLPRVRGILWGPQGELWLEQYEADPRASSTWVVLDLRGRTLATLRSPDGFRFKSVTRDRVAGVYTDEDGVESVRVYRLSR